MWSARFNSSRASSKNTFISQHHSFNVGKHALHDSSIIPDLLQAYFPYPVSIRANNETVLPRKLNCAVPVLAHYFRKLCGNPDIAHVEAVLWHAPRPEPVNHRASVLPEPREPLERLLVVQQGGNQALCGRR